MTATIPATSTSSATSVPPKAAARRGPWVRTVFQVPQPKPLPTASAPRIITIAPPNIGMPCTSTSGMRGGQQVPAR